MQQGKQAKTTPRRAPRLPWQPSGPRAPPLNGVRPFLNCSTRTRVTPPQPRAAGTGAGVAPAGVRGRSLPPTRHPHPVTRRRALVSPRPAAAIQRKRATTHRDLPKQSQKGPPQGCAPGQPPPAQDPTLSVSLPPALPARAPCRPYGARASPRAATQQPSHHLTGRTPWTEWRPWSGTWGARWAGPARATRCPAGGGEGGEQKVEW